MSTVIHTDAVRAALIDGREIALFDVRDEAIFAEAHPLFAACLPLALIDYEALDRVPRLTTTVVVYDADEGLAAPAAQRLEQLGYTDVRVLSGGLQGWRDAGGEIFRDVNTPSKAFGELVEACRHTPSLPPEEVRRRLDAGDDMIVLDARRFDEYHTMSIPTAVSAPGGELVYRAGTAALRPDTLVVVNCAGRTRSIIGTQSLINAGFPNPVAALRNGTIGWTLAGLTLDHGQSRRALSPGSGVPRPAHVLDAARSLAERAGVPRIEWSALDELLGDRSRTTYCFDVRTPEEFMLAHPRGFRSAPGGQLVQETDVFAPVRGARIVLWDHAGVRADMTGSWLAQMGWTVFVLHERLDHTRADLGSWRPRVDRPLTAATAHSAAQRYRRPYEGTDNPRDAMQAYLEWEYGLVAQLERDGTHRFQVL